MLCKVISYIGSALYWENLDNTGSGNPLTLHAGCPVLLGQKVVFVTNMNNVIVNLIIVGDCKLMVLVLWATEDM